MRVLGACLCHTKLHHSERWQQRKHIIIVNSIPFDGCDNACVCVCNAQLFARDEANRARRVEWMGLVAVVVCHSNPMIVCTMHRRKRSQPNTEQRQKTVNKHGMLYYIRVAYSTDCCWYTACALLLVTHSHIHKILQILCFATTLKISILRRSSRIPW